MLYININNITEVFFMSYVNVTNTNKALIIHECINHYIVNGVYDTNLSVYMDMESFLMLQIID